VARRLQPHEKDLYAVVSTVNELVDGRSNNVGQIQLTPNATSTMVTFPTISVSSMVALTPRSASAAATQTSVWVSTVLNGSFIITHDSNPAMDRFFDFSAVGG
jgi:hypothetical protein